MKSIYGNMFESLSKVEESSALLSESLSFYFGNFIKQFDIKNAPKENLMMTGNFEKYRNYILKSIKYAKTMNDIKYLRKDLSQCISQLTNIKNTLTTYKKDPDSLSNAKRKAAENMLSKGNTPDKIDKHIKWLKDVYRAEIDNKAKEIEAKKNK